MFKKTLSPQKNKKAENQIIAPQTPSPAQSPDFSNPKELDKKLVYSLNSKKIPTLRQLKHLTRVLNRKEKIIVSGLSFLIVCCLIFLGINFYFQNFLPIPRPGGEYVEGLIGAPQYINPLLAQTNDVDADISRLVFSGLLKYDKNLGLVNDLVDNWQASEDKKTYTFVLKDNLKWHDGQPLTADDVIFTFTSLEDPDFKSPLLISFRGVEVQKVDERTVKFILPEPYSAFLEVLTVGILPEHIWQEIPAINANLTEYNLKPIGSGPWKFKSLTKDKLGNIKSYILVPNQNYYDRKPYLEKLTFKFYPDFETAIAALKNRSIEGISFLPKELKSQLGSRRNLKYYSFYLPQYTAVFFNQKQNEFLKEKSVRQALALSIDKEEILNKALQLEGKIIDGPILPIDLKAEQKKKIDFNLEKANQILEEAGWKKITNEAYQDFLKKQAEKSQPEGQTETAGTATTSATTTQPEEEKTELPKQDFFRQKNDTILELTLTTVNWPENTQAAELIKKAWENIGVKVNLQIIEGTKISREIIKPRNYQVLLYGIIVGSDADPLPFWHSSQTQDPGLNLSSLSNREVDKLLEDVKKTTDPAVLEKNYQRFHEILIDEIPAIFLYNPTYTYVTEDKMKGINTDRIIVPADRFNNLSDWYIKTKRTWQGKTK